MDLIENIPSFLLVSFGAVLGVNSRFFIFNQLKLRKDYKILFINILSSFCLGLFYSLTVNLKYLHFIDRLGLFFFIGFLGSLSTFSTFIYDVFELLNKSEIYKALKLFIFSLFFGILSLAAGYVIGSQ